jgi:hypothetical protein
MLDIFGTQWITLQVVLWLAAVLLGVYGARFNGQMTPYIAFLAIPLAVGGLIWAVVANGIMGAVVFIVAYLILGGFLASRIADRH